MAIEVVSHPSNLANWNPQDDAYYLELFGETSPSVNEAYAEFQPAGSMDGAPETVKAAPVFEYWWTIGRPGLPQDHYWGEGLVNPSGSIWDRLEDSPAAQVFVSSRLGTDGGSRSLGRP